MGRDRNADKSLGLIAGQREHWEFTLTKTRRCTGRTRAKRAATPASGSLLTDSTECSNYGQGRDTLSLLSAGLEVTALDYAAAPLTDIADAASAELTEHLSTVVHDVREPLPFSEGSFDACYSHMLFTMALSGQDLDALAGQVRRVLRPGGLCIYTVRHVGDGHYGAGTELGDNLFENGGFVVHFFDHDLVDRLAAGFELEDVTPFEEGALPSHRRAEPGSLPRGDTDERHRASKRM